MTAFRKLSGYHHDKDYALFKSLMRHNIGLLTLAFLPGGIFILIFPEVIIQILGGDKYDASISIMMLFVIPMMLLPIDKFTGLALDALGKPGINATKVWIMVLINIVGDYVVIHLFSSLYLVAVVTTINILAGIVFGLISLRYLNKSMMS